MNDDLCFDVGKSASIEAGRECDQVNCRCNKGWRSLEADRESTGVSSDGRAFFDFQMYV